MMLPHERRALHWHFIGLIFAALTIALLLWGSPDDDGPPRPAPIPIPPDDDGPAEPRSPAFEPEIAELMRQREATA